ncbi:MULTISPECIES: oligosaccharide flippase family protein [unclassified Psychrobacter]|uniref:oligosaccharide flippase family protein n=1 Tax=unclassified Psychrobacter TaxID=196806 RepID=UPI003FCF3231
MLNAKKIKSATAWSLIETLVTMGLGVFSIIFLAKILTPEDYGKIATAQFISGFVQIILSLGLNEVVIQRKQLNDNEVQTFWTATIGMSIFSLLVCLIISLVLYMNNQAIISKVLIYEGISTSLILLSIVPTALLMRNLELKIFAYRTIISRVTFFIFAIPLAYSNYGLWSIVYANIVQSFVSFLLLYFATKSLIPKKLSFDKKFFLDSINFGFYVMIEKLLWSFLTRVLGILITIFHGPTALGLYHMATKLTDTALNILNAAVTRISLPIFSSVQDNKDKLLFAFQSSTYYFNLLSVPMFLGMALTAGYWIPLILGEKWNDIIPLLQIISVMYAIMYSRMFVGIAIKALGRSKDFLYLSLIAAIVTVIALVLTKNYSLTTALLALAIPRIIITIPLGIYLMKNICDFSITEQLIPLKIPIILGMLVTITVLLVQTIYQESLLISLSLQVCISTFLFLVIILILFKKNHLKWR